MTLNLSQLQTELWEATGTESRDLSTTILNRMLDLSWWEIQDKIGFREKQSSGTFPTVQGTDGYEISSISSDVEAVRRVYIQNIDSEAWEELPNKSYGNILAERSDSADAEAAPQRYARYENQIILDPIPDQAYTIKVIFDKTLVDADADGFPIPQAWIEIILRGAEARIWHRLGDPTRRDDTLKYRDSLVDGLSTTPVKESVSKMAAISLPRARYP